MPNSDSEIIVQLTAETAQLQAGMDAGAASVTKATEEMAAATEASFTSSHLITHLLHPRLENGLRWPSPRGGSQAKFG